MATINQLLRGARKNHNNLVKYPPQMKGTCTKVTTMTPKKPNSALRAIAKVKVGNSYCTQKYSGGIKRIKLGGKILTVRIMGEQHDLKEFSTVLFAKGNTKDLPGVKFKVIRGVYDCKGVNGRKKNRSRYGVKKEK